MLLYVRARARTDQGRRNSSKDEKQVHLATMSHVLRPKSWARSRLTLALLKHTRKPAFGLDGFVRLWILFYRSHVAYGRLEGFSEPQCQNSRRMPPQIGIVDHAACLGHQVITDHSYTAGKRASRVARRRNRENSRFIGDKNPGYNPAARPCS